MMRRRFLLVLVVGAVLAAAAGAGAAFLVRSSAYRPTIEIPGDKVLPDFTLVDQNGRDFSISSLKGRAVLIYFGYTHCPDVCPLVMTKYKQLLDALGPDADKVALIFITVDPERDTPEVMRDYLHYYSDRIIGLTGEPSRVEEVLHKYDVTAVKREPDASGNYFVDHFAFIFGADRNLVLRLAFTPEMSLQEYLDGVRYLLSK
jgi:protein SCO1/2